MIGMAIGLVSQWRERAETRLNLAASLHSRGRFAEAEALYREGIAGGGNSKENRQRVARTRLRLARVVYDQGDQVEAERLYRNAIAEYRSVFPRDDPNIAHALVTFGLLMRTHRRFDEAEALLREAHEINLRFTPANRRAIGESATHVANVLITLGRSREAVPLAREAIAHHSLAAPRDETALGFAHLELGRALLALGEFRDAESQLLSAHNALVKTDAFHLALLAPLALYTTWNQAEPGKDHDSKAQQWTQKLIATFVELDQPAIIPQVAPD
jgi:tetratricopeptide (TPR) repeat protein